MDARGRPAGGLLEGVEGRAGVMLYVEAELDKLRPAMEADGGGVELVAIDQGTVKIRLKGTCLVCPSVKLTLKLGIEKTLKARFDWIEEVVRVN